MKKISIIIPVYNVEKYLYKCLNSIINQTYKNYEVILIDDGSKDNSGKICKEYTKKYPNFIYKKQKNQGPAIARNNGMKLANSTYIMFIDSDDYLDENYLQSYINKSKEKNYDLIIGGYKKVTNEKINFIRKLEEGEFSKYIVMGPYCKLYKLEFLKKNNLEFIDTNASEDVYFNICLYSKNPKIGIIDDISYNYNYNSESISNTAHKGFNENVDIIKFAKQLDLKGIKNKELNDYYIIRYLIWYLLYSGKTSDKNKYIEMNDKIINYINEAFPNYKNNKYLKKKPKGEKTNLYIIIRIYMIINKLKLVKIFTKIYCKG